MNNNLTRSLIFTPLVVLLWSCQEDKLTAPEGFEIHPDFALELVASEPLSADPVDLEFNEFGEALVLEMPGYPFEDRESRIVRLVDSDDDGVFDDTQVFAENLELASSIMPFKKGVLVAAPPYLLHLIDTDKDGKADKRDTLMGGFSTGNLQHNYNGLTFGLDGWIYAANGGNSGSPYWWGDTTAMLDLRGQDMRFQPDQKLMERIGESSGGYELAIDEWGRIFETHNLHHISQLVYPGRYLTMSQLNAADLLSNVSDHEENGLSRIYPIGEQDTRVNHPEQSGYFSGSCGITYYGGGAFGAEWNNTVWVADVVLNLLHVDHLSKNGSALKASRVIEKKDFLASRDRSSRPVNMTVGPDGAMYLVDMYREVIEHPEWIPDDIEATLDLHAGKDMGRIYRITRKGAGHNSFDYSNFSNNKGLVESLADDNQWVRNTAHRTLLGREIDDSVVGALDSAIKGEHVFAQLHAMWILHTIKKLSPESLAILLDSDVSELQENALIVAEDYLNSETILDKTIQLMTNADARVRMQSALTMSTLDSEQFEKKRELILDQIEAGAIMGMDEWNVSSFTLASNGFGHDLFVSLMGQEESKVVSLLKSLASVSGNSGGSVKTILNGLVSRSLTAENVSDIVDNLTLHINQNLNGRSFLPLISQLETNADEDVLASLARMRKRLSLPSSQVLIAYTQKAVKAVKNKELSSEERLKKLALIDLLPYREKSEVLYQLLDNKEALDIQEVALRQLWESSADEVGEKLVEIWADLGPQSRRLASDVLLYKEKYHDALLTGLEEGKINIGEMNFDLERRRTLLWWTDDENTKRRAEALFSDSGVVNRKEVIDEMKGALAIQGKVDQGATVFTNLCSQCHIYGNIGKDVGPVLTEIHRKSKESLLHEILDPNAAVDTKYINHKVETIDGSLHIGIVESETDASVTIAKMGGSIVTIEKDQIKSFSSLGTSLMMEGLEANMSHQDMADLLAFLQQQSI